MKVIVVGNLARRNEIRGKKKDTILAGGSYFAAVQAARMGHDVILISKISNSFPAKWLKEIEKEGVKIIKQPAWEFTDYDVKYNKDGTKTVNVHSDAGPIMAIPPMECDVAIITSYIGYISPAVVRALKTENNVVLLDSQGFTKYKNPAGELSYVPWLEKEEFLRNTDILKLNTSELYYLTGKSTLNSASELLKHGPKIVTLTLGTKGAYVFHEKRYIKVPVYEETKFKDKTGVGDVYSTAFAIKYFETRDVTDSSYFASAAASYCIEKKGSDGIADLKKINKRFKTLKEIFLV